MHSKGGILILLAVIGGGAAGGYFLAQHHAAAARADQQVPVSKRAMDAYTAGRYAEAVPLLKEWAQTLSVKTDSAILGPVLLDLADARAKVKAIADGAAAATQPVVVAPPASSPAALQAQSLAVATGQANTDPSTGKPRVPHPAPIPGQLLNMTIKELGNFEFDPTADTGVPPDVKALNGTKVRLRGFMIPLNQAETITDFALVPSLVGCCFGQPPGVQHTITCKTAKGQAVGYSVDEIYVEGIIKINVQRDQGYTFSIFDLDVTSVKAVE
jgi:hypothetical protein